MIEGIVILALFVLHIPILVRLYFKLVKLVIDKLGCCEYGE